ncbi:Glycoside-hydrolase family GH114 [Lentzea albida]|uniref:Glycoside-hydrolase family GH114 n=1 Tax=Lentzea albida TaxID=65499 RepID=A0A1H9ESE4_9PSEU|nr:Glycoside-hydrolase family GH114 [Lentzea albida]
MDQVSASVRPAWVVLVSIALLAGCSGQEAAPAPTAPRAGVALPPSPAVLDYQLGAAYPPPAGVTLVARDSTASPAPGVHNVCYVNGFQTQPQDRELWLTRRGHLVLKDSGGEPVIDPEWPDELLVDTSSPSNRDELARLVGESITRCADRGFQSVEIDNLDSYSRSGDRLTAEHNLAFAALLSARAHDRGLPIGQKNSAEISRRAHDEVGFDFAVTEECHAFNECSTYTDVYGAHVMDVEYTDNLRGTFAGACADPATPRTTTLRDRGLVGPENPDHVFQHC